MENDREVKVNGSFLIPLSLKRWIEETARRDGVSTAEVVRRVLEAARSETESRDPELSLAS